MTRLGWLAIGLLLIAGGGILWWAERGPPPIVWQGYAEADFVEVGPTQQGLLTALFVQRGDKVTPGTPLFAQDDTDDRGARDQAAHMLTEAGKQLANLQAGGKPTEIEQARDNLADDQATLVRTFDDLSRGEELLRRGVVTQQSIDLLQADRRSAQAKVEALQAALAQSLAPLGRDLEIQAQSATVAAARASLAMAVWRLGQRRVTAPTGGRIADVLARPGETLAAGAPVVSLLPPGNIFVRFFVPEAAFSTIHLGDAVTLACDGRPAGMAATITFISPQAEYTPPLIYSESNSSKMVFLVEARPRPEQAALLNPGEPIEVRPAGSRTP